MIQQKLGNANYYDTFLFKFKCFFLISCPWLVLKFVLKRYLDIGEKVIIVVSYHSVWLPNTENKAM